jgi:hypothetical protein
MYFVKVAPKVLLKGNVRRSLKEDVKVICKATWLGDRSASARGTVGAHARAPPFDSE